MRTSRSIGAGVGAMAVIATLLTGTSDAADAPDTTNADEFAPPGSVVVRDISIPVEGQDPVAAWLVRPSHPTPHAQAGVLWLHWLGEIHGDRSEFLSEAIDLAGEGTISILPQGTFPWVGDPVGNETDVAAVEAQITAFQAALRELRGRRGVDDSRVAIVGHDYGAMYGMVVADRGKPVKAMVAAAPDATWSNWFATFWLDLDEEETAAYAALFDGLDPVDHADRLGSHLLLQWAGEDFFIPESVRDEFAAAAPEAQKIVYPGVDHEFTTQAQIDRLAFLREQLGLS